MKLALLFFILLVALAAQAQQGVRLTSRFSKRQKFFAEGSRVVYRYANHPMVVSHYRSGYPVYGGIAGVGILHLVNDSTIQVDAEVIKIKDLLFFGRRTKGAWVGSAVLIVGGCTLALASRTTDENGLVTYSPAAVTIGLAMEVTGIIEGISRQPKSMSAWRAEIVH